MKITHCYFSHFKLTEYPVPTKYKAVNQHDRGLRTTGLTCFTWSLNNLTEITPMISHDESDFRCEGREALFEEVIFEYKLKY